MARDFSKKFYNSKQWIKCRESYKQSKHGICERCDMPGEEVHHKVWLTPENINDPYITLSWDNLELLCQSCHSKEHMSKYDVVRDDVMFNEKGDLIRNESRDKRSL
jgi:5-methylcytosine-specific restriction protein A